ncbi:anthranilate synthase component I family protein [Roseivirga sp. E12]|uniref:anthranilate synthase component I family protein n=1 Tax=Roseivirga sp. E12 TaxID=2819237 RepID=UPI001ABD0C12|nr:anthranilate synthase component I family protein [Roseivirga sp. E12]MBO3696927.1 anthranilate synthase component I family protein [Roseivirga sp. E12]
MTTINFPYKGLSKDEFLLKSLTWAEQHSHFAYFNANQISYPHDGFRHVLAVGAHKLLEVKKGTAFNDLKDFQNEITASRSLNDWIVGYLGYDLKNEVERLESQNNDRLGFPETQFFNPNHLLLFGENSLELLTGQEDVFEIILNTQEIPAENEFTKPKASVSKEDYLSNVERLRQHIEEGDCYEVNYCQEFHGEIGRLNPIALYRVLNDISPNPFSCLQKFNEHYIISASPERFLKRNGSTVISQPIKGTRPRSEISNEDIRLKTDLRNDPKEQAENMMIVDLVRNDLARTAKTGSVKVEEIFGIYSFPQVHQMISTITAEIKNDIDSIDVIEKAFPMGSMTGAPKVKVMELIEKYENTKRGPFSGAAGYFIGDQAFDFNVLIRSLFVNQETGTYSFQVGGAITYDSIPEKEYEECMVKAKAIFELIKKSYLVLSSPLNA